ncbi:MAG: sigma-54 interaction domain-containing protein, partial [Desulforhopalus sp.]
RSLEVKFRTVADFTYDWECWLQPDGRFRYVSPSCKRLTGYPVEDFISDPSLFRKIIHPDDQQLWDEHYRESREEAALREVQFRIIRTDGEVRWIEHACQPVIDEIGCVQGFRSSNRDITGRKNSELELHQALVEIEKYKEQLEAESEYLREEMKLSQESATIIGSSNTLEYVFFKIEQVADSDTTVLLLGETGTGKELFAKTIHNASMRKDRSLVKIDCAALPEYLIESELFGHEKGAFTGADHKRIGRFELADGGTIFLDEIGELPLDLQPKLLRVLQNGEFARVGSSKTRRVDVRVIAATNRDLHQDVVSGRFRKDLWYRLNVFPITAPPLRDRIEDIPQLVRYFIDRHSCRQRKNITTIPVEVMTRLGNYHWPGNVRELENVIERAVINTSGNTLALADELRPPSTPQTKKHLQTLEEMECRYITEVLEQTDWKVSGKDSAAEILGLKRSTLRARMKKCNIRRPQ